MTWRDEMTFKVRKCNNMNRSPCTARRYVHCREFSKFCSTKSLGVDFFCAFYFYEYNKPIRNVAVNDAYISFTHQLLATLNVVFFLKKAAISPDSISSGSTCNTLLNTGQGEGKYP